MDALRRDGRRWWLALCLIALLGLGLRIGFVFAYEYPSPLKGDANFFHPAANLLADGRGFVNPIKIHFGGLVAPSANHPPAYSVVLAASSVLGLSTPLAHQLWSCVLGTWMVVVLGMAGREIAGKRVGLIAAAFAAGYPNFWINDGLIMSETLVQLLVAVVLLLVYRCLRRPTIGNAIALGIACGLGALTRGELLLVAPLLVLPLGWAVRAQLHRRAFVFVCIALGATLLTIAPWPIYNATRFDEPVVVSTQLGAVLRGANCDLTYHGRYIGYWTFLCSATPVKGAHGDDSVLDGTYRTAAFRYVRANLGRVPFVVFARVGRELGFFRPGQTVTFGEREGRPMAPSLLGLLCYYALLVFSVPGFVMLRRLGVRIWPLLGICALVVGTAAAAYGATRFRVPLEVALIVPAAVAVSSWTRSRGHVGQAGSGAGVVELGAAGDEEIELGLRPGTASDGSSGLGSEDGFHC